MDRFDYVSIALYRYQAYEVNPRSWRNKQIYFRHFFAKLFRHFGYSLSDSSAHTGIGEAANRSGC